MAGHRGVDLGKHHVIDELGARHQRRDQPKIDIPAGKHRGSRSRNAIACRTARGPGHG
jgi:hypothetical protein